VNFLRLKLGYSDEHTTSPALLVNRDAKADGDTHPWYLTSSSYVKNIQVVAWMRRFISNSRPSESKQTGTPTVQEYPDVETVVIRNELSEGVLKQSERIGALVVIKAAGGLYHVKTKLTYREQVLISSVGDVADSVVRRETPSCQPVLSL